MAAADVREACKLLFLAPPRVVDSLLGGLDGARLKQAYRRAARRTHPDHFGHLSENERQQRAEAFIQIGKAYRLLSSFLDGDCSASQIPQTSAPRTTGGSAGRSYRMPDRPLRFGEFLVHSGVVSRDALARAIAWQRQAAPRLGRIASDWRWIGAEEIEAAAIQRRAGERLGAALVRQGLLTPFGLKVLVRHQEKVRPRLGSYFVTQGWLSPERLQRYLQLQASHNACRRLRRR
jgi:hypothetical protein